MRTKNSGLFGSLDLGSIDLHDCSDGNDHTQSGDDGRFFAEKTMPISIATTGSMDTIMEAFPLSMYRMPAVYARLGIVVDSKPAPKIAKTTGMQSASIASFICQNL